MFADSKTLCLYLCVYIFIENCLDDMHTFQAPLLESVCSSVVPATKAQGVVLQSL